MNWGRIFFDVDLITGVSRRTGTMRRRKNWPGPFFWTRAGWRLNLAMLTSQLTAILRCNAPLVTGLEKAIEDRPPLKLAQAMIALSDDLSSGMRLAEAMAGCPRFYPRWYVDLIRAGESTGTLEEALRAAGEHIAASQRFSKRVHGWLLYLGFIFSFQMAIGAFLLYYVMPEFRAMFAEFGVPSPWIMGEINNTAFRLSRLPMALFFIALWSVPAFWLARRLAGDDVFRLHRVFDRFLARIPIAGQMTLKTNLASVCAVMERLAAARIPINEILRDCAELDVPGRIRRALNRAQARVEMGATLGDALEAEPVLPDSFVTLLALGEQAGRLETAAGNLRTMYEEQVYSRTHMILDIAGPLGVLALGTIAFVVYGGVFLMLTELTSVISGQI